MVNRFNLQGILRRNMSRVARLAKPFAHHLSPFTFHHSQSTRLSPFTFHLSPRSGFTLIEILVASLLLGMLMTILTMVFNSSAIAWRTGRASNAMMGKARRQLSYAQYLADNALPRVDTVNNSQVGRVLSAWDKNGTPRDRAVEIFPAGRFPFNLPNWASQGSAGASVPQPWQQVRSVQNLRADGGSTHIVGVLSWGPDGKLGTTDDINTLPLVFE